VMMYWNQHNMSGWDWFAMSIGSVLLWALLVAIAVLLYRNLNRTHDLPHTRPVASPEQVLADRFARGEIDEDEYRNRLAVLRTDGSRYSEH
jgi:putative membrane protein